MSASSAESSVYSPSSNGDTISGSSFSWSTVAIVALLIGGAVVVFYILKGGKKK